jgi:hypothetical protein
VGVWFNGGDTALSGGSDGFVVVVGVVVDGLAPSILRRLLAVLTCTS